ncbi:actin cytoskeleton-regulatory complex protein pan1-like [Cannabis sativa]|uniref:actin cytoskeleton-regulatory complex protein pan1-like n=1 Tax=Cannabis sativa TaxID=3483 RepID=UPI0029CA3B8B|nr:actin cytoskeleton-regulatory complex protein pan1-like [Cannabis sativa]
MGSRRAQPEGGPSAQTTRPRRTQPDVGPSTRTTRSRRTQRGNGQNLGTKDEELNRGGAQSMGERTYETESCRLRRRLEEAQRQNAELECEAASARATQGTNAQNQLEPGVRRPQGRPRGSRTKRQEKAREEQPEENETPPENQDEQPERRQLETDEQEIPDENEEDLGTQLRE